ncbi:MAG: hypothetical protein HOD92_18810 [Deltaproteobacteria bacterium]|nr:hypothetical protein [Deltaproteobacteria bacterium]
MAEKHLGTINNNELKSGLAYHLGYAYGESEKSIKWSDKNKTSTQQLIKKYQ